MRRYLVVAHRTLGGAHLMEHLHELREADPYCRFHFVVPQYHPRDHAYTEAETEATAQAKLDEMLERMAVMGMGATGEVGDANAVYAVMTAIRHCDEEDAPITGIVVSTLPHRVSAWWDVPHRIERDNADLPVTHIVAEDSLVG